jgi:hypothetical protein
MVFAFLIRSKIGPGANPLIHDEKITDDRFMVLVGLGGDTKEKHIDILKDMLQQAGAQGITVKDDVQLTKNY